MIFGQLCSRRFSWQFFIFAAAVLTTGVARLTTVALSTAVRFSSGVSDSISAPLVAAVAL